MSGEGAHGPPPSLFSHVYEHEVKPAGGSLHFLDEWFGFSAFEKDGSHAGMFQFEGLCFALIAAVLLAILSFALTRGYQRKPGPFRNLLEMSVEGLRSMFRMLMGPEADPYLPYLGTLFIYIFVLNLIGLIPLGRSPTMALSTTLALGVTTFCVVQVSGIRVNGVRGYLKHFCGPVLYLAPLMFPIEILGELVKPISLSLRLKGNIGGEDILIEQLLHLGGSIPLHLPILIFAVFTSFLQAFIFTALAAIYIQIQTAHEDDH